MVDEAKDIFDKIFNLTFLRRYKDLYIKYREGLLYLFFGGLTFFLAIGVFIVFNSIFEVSVLWSNIISWISGVMFSFFTTRKWVFRRVADSLYKTVFQMLEFASARLLTLGLQEALLYIFVTVMGYNSILTKVLTESINIILNYLASKFVIFRKRKR